MEEINASIGFDRKLYAQDIQGSLAHAAMLAKTGIITADDYKQIEQGLKTILKEIEDGKFTFSRKLEDIHMNIEARLADLIGPSAGRLHTARSRNDQVAVDFRLWVKQELEKTAAALKNLIEAFLERAEEHAATAMPGTSVTRACARPQYIVPISFSWMFRCPYSTATRRPGGSRRIPNSAIFPLSS